MAPTLDTAESPAIYVHYGVMYSYEREAFPDCSVLVATKDGTTIYIPTFGDRADGDRKSCLML